MYRHLKKRIIASFILALMLLALPASDVSHVAFAKKTTSSKKKTKKQKKKTTPELNKKKLILPEGAVVRLRVKRAKTKVKWTSNDHSVVTIKPYGSLKNCARVTARSSGTALITAKIGSRTLKCRVKVASEDGDDQTADSNWKHGTWSEDNCYYNGSGESLASLSAALSTSAPSMKRLKNYPYFYIGASRTRNTSMAVTDKKVYFYYCSGAGFDWFFTPKKKYGEKVKPAFQMIRAYLAQKPGGTVIIDLGGNDLSNIDAYIGFYQKLNAMYPRATFWFMGVLPREKGDPTNPSRKAFNEKLMEALPGQVINLYDKVYHLPGFKTKDGTHYYPKQCRKIYQMVMKKIGRNITVDLKTGKATKK